MQNHIDHKYDPLFEPFKINKLEVPNRIIPLRNGRHRAHHR